MISEMRIIWPENFSILLLLLITMLHHHHQHHPSITYCHLLPLRSLYCQQWLPGFTANWVLPLCTTYCNHSLLSSPTLSNITINTITIITIIRGKTQNEQSCCNDSLSLSLSSHNTTNWNNWTEKWNTNIFSCSKIFCKYFSGAVMARSIKTHQFKLPWVLLTCSPLMNHMSCAAGLERPDVQLTRTVSPIW